jgi:hypothetical protein
MELARHTLVRKDEILWPYCIVVHAMAACQFLSLLLVELKRKECCQMFAEVGARQFLSRVDEISTTKNFTKDAG